MPTTPLVTADEIATLGAIRLVHVAAKEDGPQSMIHVPIEDWIAAARRSASGFDDLGHWQAAIEALGVGHDAVSVVMDDGRMTEAARVWFILQYFGLPAVVLNGGIAALTHPPAQEARHEGPLRLEAGSGPVGLAERRGLAGDLAGVQVLDARTQAEHWGEDLRGNARGGHLPGAALLAHADLLDGSLMKPADQITELMARAGIEAGKPVVTHCNGGGRGALAALAAVVAGQKDVRVYYLGFADWAADESCPVLRPEGADNNC
ncbi:sulfurtransferase [Roseicyclus mahoneyensis]|uniref:Thiosulfate/3-mercaptopyruvate sulfurtransferase n=1 Tax=Roseicyclus mahoneyensis TaxID=164332 RepID=A0A316GKB8_9RHOB|nr:rhodanese-like domain-containing protein [Roseicyclus mahoneyensis]PWK60647.1 thiosulfate/3-mercaptopyruvate sulfurtransferase [Roseicyclus mahoneyensis]